MGKFWREFSMNFQFFPSALFLPHANEPKPRPNHQRPLEFWARDRRESSWLAGLLLVELHLAFGWWYDDVVHFPRENQPSESLKIARNSNIGGYSRWEGISHISHSRIFHSQHHHPHFSDVFTFLFAKWIEDDARRIRERQEVWKMRKFVDPLWQRLPWKWLWLV